MKREAGEVLREGEENKGENKKKGKRGGGGGVKGNILIIIIFKGRLIF